MDPFEEMEKQLDRAMDDIDKGLPRVPKMDGADGHGSVVDAGDIDSVMKLRINDPDIVNLFRRMERDGRVITGNTDAVRRIGKQLQQLRDQEYLYIGNDRKTGMSLVVPKPGLKVREDDNGLYNFEFFF